MWRFQDPYFLLLLVFIPVLVYWFLFHGLRREGTIRFPHLGVVKQVGTGRPKRARFLLLSLRVLAMVFLILGIARPQAGSKEEEVLTEGVDIMLVMDVSTSMLAEDFKPNNRIHVSKLVAADFIKGRTNDRIGMVVFAGVSFVQCPLTLDYGILLRFLEEIDAGMIEDGTAIGMALANCVNRLKDSKAESKVVILLTDGRNNRGELDPLTAAQVAKAMDVKIYAIGAGTRGEALYPVQDPVFGKRYVRMPVDIDEPLLQSVADMTGGKYFRATNRESLEQIYNDIGEMEKTEIRVKEYTRYTELFGYFLLPAILFFLAEVVLANTKFRKIP